MNYWLLVNREMVTFTGSECNKIGVGYTAFQTQGQRCNVPVNSCLENQIHDILMEDIERVQNQQSPHYLVTGQFEPENLKYLKHNATEQVYLSYETTNTQTTMITIEMSADNLVFYSTVAKGMILKANIRLDNFEAMSGDGYIDYMIMNEDNFNSTFYVELKDCSNDILSVPSHEIAIGALKLYSSSFKVQTTKTEEQNYTCNLVLKNSEGSQIDLKEVNFTTSVQVNKTVDQGNEGGNNNTTPAEQEWKDNGGGCGS